MLLNLVTETLLPIALFTMMFGIGASTSSRDFFSILATPKSLIVGVCSLSIISPLLGLTIAWALKLPAELSLGLVLLASCPGGLFSNYMTALGRGALALSISLTLATSLIYIFAAPIWVQLGASFFGNDVHEIIVIPYDKILKPLLVFLLLPVALGLFFRLKCPDLNTKTNKVVRDIGGVAAILCFILIIYEQRSTFIENFNLSFPPVLIFNLATVSIGLVLARLVALNPEDVTALLIEHTIRQEATGIYIAIAVLGSLTSTMPLLINTIIGMGISMFIVLIARRVVRPATLE